MTKLMRRALLVSSTALIAITFIPTLGAIAPTPLAALIASEAQARGGDDDDDGGSESDDSGRDSDSDRDDSDDDNGNNAAHHIQLHGYSVPPPVDTLRFEELTEVALDFSDLTCGASTCHRSEQRSRVAQRLDHHSRKPGVDRLVG